MRRAEEAIKIAETRVSYSVFVGVTSVGSQAFGISTKLRCKRFTKNSTTCVVIMSSGTVKWYIWRHYNVLDIIS